MRKIILSIEGMTCSACSNGLEKYLNKQNGIINASVNLVMANATIDYDENILDQEKIERYVKQAGFVSLGVFKELKLERKVKNEKIKLVIFTGLAFILIYNTNVANQYRGIAQLVEQWSPKPRAVGSNPTAPAKDVSG